MRTPKSGRRGGDPIARARRGVGTPAHVLARHGVGRVRELAPCPACRGLKLCFYYDTKTHKERWYCFGCNARGEALDLEARLSSRSRGDVYPGVL
jgi:hypothetical protein